MNELFSLSGKICVITGGAGLLGFQHAQAIASAGGTPVLVDIDQKRAADRAQQIVDAYNVPSMGFEVDITDHESVSAFLKRLIEVYSGVDVLINNAANNPKMESTSEVNFSRLENFSLKQWNDDISVGLTGAFVCSQVIGSEMARRGGGVIVNVASDLALIGPDQRLYRDESLPEHLQPVKPVTYSVVKSGLVGLTRYLATYWADKGIRVNAISPGGVYNSQPDEFVAKLSSLIPMGRMANLNEYQGAIVFLCSEASSYMTGTNLVIDGGRTCW
jgi:NAD(P)-dependent dehydrogenase (short-subunit alcohol dehydrogenase family)